MKKKTGLEHMPQLDGLRALAVFGVLLHHFLPWAYLNGLALAGVKLFFILSGFLITGILLRSRDIREENKQTWAFSIRQFYIRRFLRIFPLYYFVVAIALIINVEPVRQILPWLLTYTLNIHMANQGWFVDHFAHFWTLAVEEQFYIVWPWFILFTPRKWLVPSTLAFILVAPLYRGYEMFIGLNGLASYIFTLASLDSLGMGALLAIAIHAKGITERLSKALNGVALPVGLGMALFLNFFAHQGITGKINATFYDLMLALFFVWLVFRTANGFGGIFGWLLESKPVTYIGKISYGMYVYHPFVPSLCRFVFAKAGWVYPEASVLKFAIQSIVTFVISSLSWQLLEGPINNLKRHFNYQPDSNSKTKNSIHSFNPVFAFSRNPSGK